MLLRALRDCCCGVVPVVVGLGAFDFCGDLNSILMFPDVFLDRFLCFPRLQTRFHDKIFNQVFVASQVSASKSGEARLAVFIATLIASVGSKVSARGSIQNSLIVRTHITSKVLNSSP